MKFMFWVIVAMIAALWIPHKMDETYAKGVAEGRRTALKLNPPSEELELACMALWVGEQNKKAWKKQKI